MHFIVGVDGSEASRHAFQLAVSFWKSHDTISVVHVSDPAKDQAALPFDFRAASIEEWYRTRCPAFFPPGTWRYVGLIKSAGRDTKDELLAFINDPATDADLLIVGMVGRKGPKEAPHVIGRTSDLSLREAHMSSCICKLREVPAASLIVCAVDGSDFAHLGVELAEHVKRPADRVVLLHIDDPTNLGGGGAQFRAAAVEARYASTYGSRAGWSFVRLAKPGGVSIADTIINYTTEQAAHTLVLGADGTGAYACGRRLALGSCTDALVGAARCNVISMQSKGRKYAGAAVQAEPASSVGVSTL